jgi:hypothetical protein
MPLPAANAGLGAREEPELASAGRRTGDASLDQCERHPTKPFVNARPPPIQPVPASLEGHADDSS